MKQKQTLITRLAGSHRSIASRLLLLTLLLFNFVGGAKAISPITKDISGHFGGEGRYYLVASPIGEVSPENVNMCANAFDLYSFDPEAEDEWRNYKAGEFDNLEPGRGYLYANSDNVTLTFTGMPFEDDYYEITVHEGWNLLGNPFECDVYVSGDGGIYVMNDEGTGLVEANRAIKSMEGFFYYAWEDGASVTLVKEGEHSVSGGGDPEDIVLPEHGRDDNHNGIKEPEDEPTTQMQTIALTAGWNWVSFYVEITLDDLKFALVEAGTGIIINSQSSGSTTYNGTRWRGTLNSLNLSQMYQIMVPQDCEITLGGMPIDPTEHPVTIQPGYNWIAFPLNEGMTPANAFAGFAVSGDKIIFNTSSSTYNGRMWRGPLQDLTPGQGYIYYSAIFEDRVLVFPTSY